ncbi:MAG: [FeFe] hydrogenase H-cluster radical SAM maturase HydE [Firmicutes bacterium]|nr:[FeFe] hydrogenase H-cluster radical SAM maturase HydE [Bacillota bacterium]
MKQEVKLLIDKLYKTQELTKEEWVKVIKERDEESAEYIFSLAQPLAQKHFGNQIYTRGLIEFTNICRNDCLYCGIRKSNTNVDRYRLTLEQILECCKEGYKLGFRTFVLQGGEDAGFSKEKLAQIISTIKKEYPDAAITLSFGEWAYEDYKLWKEAGADRYLLRHETASEEHYKKLHPSDLSLSNRMRCLQDLKSLGYQVGTGFMVGSPFQTEEELATDFLFLKEFKPEMIGIGPFIPHHQTPFRDKEAGSLELTVYCLGLLRLMLPDVLLPATTALGTISPMGREQGIKAGANVIMPNLSPLSLRKKYTLYDNKIGTSDESKKNVEVLKEKMKAIGYELAVSRGDYKKMEE